MIDVLEVRRSAAGRLLARQRPAEFKLAGRNLDGSDIRVQVAGGPGEFTAARDAAEWFDERPATSTLAPRDPVHVALCEIAVAARDGAAAAAAAVRTGKARSLPAWGQWRVFLVLSSWQGLEKSPMNPAAAAVMRAIFAEWGRLRLAADQPDDEEQVLVTTVNQADLDAGEKRRWIGGPPLYIRPACLDLS